jgi:integrase
LVPAFGPLRLDEISPPMVREWFARLSTGPTARARAYGLLNTIMGTAVTDDLIPANPCRVRGGSRVERAREPRPATREELELIAERIRPEYSAAVLLAGFCGLRFGEIAELRRRDVDLPNATLHIRRAVTFVDGEAIVGQPKSRAGIRVVHVPPHLLPVLGDHLRTYTALGRDALVFAAPSGGHLRGHGALHESFREARKVADRPDLTFHHLRHTAAVMAAQKGATLAEVQRRLGHSTVVAAMRYQHGTDARNRFIAEALSEPEPSAGVVELKSRGQRSN